MKIVHKRMHFSARTETWRRIVVFEVEAGEAPEPNELFFLGGFHSATTDSAHSPTGLISFDEPRVERIKHSERVRIRIEQIARRDV